MNITDYVGLLLAAVFVSTSAHMELSFPHPRGDPTDPRAGPPDYNLKSPLPSPVMCKGKPPGTPLLTVRAGEVVPVRFKGTARHGGGICQFALSYDGDKTFVVIQEIKGACPDGKQPIRKVNNVFCT